MKKVLDPKNAWRSVLAEARRQLREADENASDEKKPEEGEDSLDDQVDRYLTDYEKEAKAAKNEGKDWRSTVKRLLGEAEDDEEGEDEEAGDEGDEGGDEGGDLGDEPIKAPKMKTGDIDMGSYVNSVVRLINNYDNLLEVRNTILRRAANFLGKLYDEETVLAFNEELSSSHGLEIGKSKREKDYEDFPAPPADRAGGSGSPGGT